METDHHAIRPNQVLCMPFNVAMPDMVGSIAGINKMIVLKHNILTSQGLPSFVITLECQCRAYTAAECQAVMSVVLQLHRCLLICERRCPALLLPYLVVLSIHRICTSHNLGSMPR